MKKILFLSLLSLFVISCNNDDDSSSNSSIIWRWELISSVLDNEKSEVDNCSRFRIFDFRNNGALFLTSNTFDPETLTCIEEQVTNKLSTYTVRGNQLFIDFDNSDNNLDYEFEITNNTLILKLDLFIRRDANDPGKETTAIDTYRRL